MGNHLKIQALRQKEGISNCKCCLFMLKAEPVGLNLEFLVSPEEERSQDIL